MRNGRRYPILLIAMSASGGELAREATLCLQLPAGQTYQIQELTLPVYHALCAMVEAHYFAIQENLS